MYILKVIYKPHEAQIIEYSPFYKEFHKLEDVAHFLFKNSSTIDKYEVFEVNKASRGNHEMERQFEYKGDK
jgi:hypothetical protein